ncbi:hypothetical protein FC62_GL000423 [Amylolactobacillus amylotrophicus DSM 20534]|uniref:Uncharacterized protein n=3 Tax=Amylolactobacillus TaxID=2767876 RepID=A0A0R1YJG9_9LACO|nr:MULTISPECIES: prepilin-type N-terminal cleavage/methylation domain-containing protein [Amylolactobacillus]APT19003.1 hypothetical protein LA20533_06980 [Amylolactobacillus amylophilus DSM 20533 = JCM 1125]KRK38733.1 hypothetical protein FC62_GL000423 [Amylolactobacillus amylotrophicus DSM 20534]KRM42624.1 hypothetical protein FD40_GL000416 [Amylolactobacillus amylophilus DSM 20533 = JCM 1125]GED79953.1 competence protein ComGC [Amylolactobacillus amylophilus]
MRKIEWNNLGKSKRVGGFTLIEMVIVVLIIAMLTVLILPNAAKQKGIAEQKTDTAFIQTIQSQIDIVDTESERISFAALKENKHITNEQYNKLQDGYVLNADGTVAKKGDS